MRSEVEAQGPTATDTTGNPRQARAWALSISGPQFSAQSEGAVKARSSALPSGVSVYSTPTGVVGR